MPKAIFLLFSHRLTEEQIDQLKGKGIERFFYLPDSLQELWSKVPTGGIVLSEYLVPIVKWLSETAKKSDWVLVQGDFGATFYMVDFCFSNGFVPVYATSERVAVEKRDGAGITKVSRFEHCAFREYERFCKNG